MGKRDSNINVIAGKQKVAHLIFNEFPAMQPNLNGDYLCCISDDFGSWVTVLEWNSGKFEYDDDTDWTEDVTAWADIPQGVAKKFKRGDA